MNTFTTGLRKTSSLLSMNRRSPYNLRSLTSEKNDKKIVNDKKNQMFYINLNGGKYQNKALIYQRWCSSKEEFQLKNAWMIGIMILFFL